MIIINWSLDYHVNLLFIIQQSLLNCPMNIHSSAYSKGDAKVTEDNGEYLEENNERSLTQCESAMLGVIIRTV